MKKKSINNIIVITLGLILVLSFININVFNHLNDYLEKSNHFLTENLKSADFYSFIEGSGEDINITLHQSLLNTTTKQFSNLDNDNTFIQVCPPDAAFNSSYINVTIDNIYAPNKTLEIEDDYSYWHKIKDGGVGYRSAGSFNVDFKCYLTNISVYLYYDDPAHPCDLKVNVLDSVWSGSASMPGSTVIGTLSENYQQYLHIFMVG